MAISMVVGRCRGRFHGRAWDDARVRGRSPAATLAKPQQDPRTRIVDRSELVACAWSAALSSAGIGAEPSPTEIVDLRDERGVSDYPTRPGDWRCRCAQSKYTLDPCQRIDAR